MTLSGWTMPTPNDGAAWLEAGGFVRIGAWQRDQTTGSIKFAGESEPPRDAGVYAYSVNGVVHYVGSAQRGIHGRLRRYEITKTARTSARVRSEILGVLDRGLTVDVYVMHPPPMELNGLPIDTVAGLEEALIRQLRPIWNRRSNRSTP